MRRALAAVLAAALLLSAVFTGCGDLFIGSGHLVTEEYDFSDFDRVEVGSAFVYEIVQSDSYSVRVTTDDNLIGRVQITQAGSTLRIALEEFLNLGSVTLKAVVTMPQLRGLVSSGATRGLVTGFSSTEDIYIRVSGASSVVDDIIAGDAEFEVSGASTVRLEGSANDMVARVSGASSFDLENFVVNNADVSFSGASTGTVNVTGRLDAELSGASKLSYIGEPTMGTINTSGASTLSKK